MAINFSILFVSLALLQGLVYGHISMWHPSMPDYKNGDEPATPLSKLSFEKWWFHGNLGKDDKSAAPLVLPAGKSVTVNLGCKREVAEGSGNDPCPDDPPSMHADSPNEILGCGLAIAYKSEFEDVEPEDFVVFSANHQCVTTVKTSFGVPAKMPSCPNGKCICAWFWQGQSSVNEMYMTGFRCNVRGGTDGLTLAKPQPPVFCGKDTSKCVSGPKQPMYWGNERSNVDFSGRYREKPSYNDAWGFSDGAQDIGSGSGSGSGSSQADSDSAESTSAPAAGGKNSTAPEPTTFITRTRTSPPAAPTSDE